ncbi:MAG: hypothetical protein V4722_23625 [Bacteroidota bacterium]
MLLFSVFQKSRVRFPVTLCFFKVSFWVCLLFVSISGEAQVVATVKFPEAGQASPTHTDSIKAVNVIINSFNTSSSRNFNGLNALRQTLVKKSDLDIRIANLVKKVDSFLNVNNAAMDQLHLDSIPLEEASKTVPEAASSKEGEEEGTCNKLETIKGLRSEKQSDGNYLFTLFDIDESPIKSFILKQFNEQLFKDKLSRALHSLCEDSPVDGKIAAILKQFEKRNLYDRFLEASLEVDNSQDLAGVLRIFKQTHIHFKAKNVPHQGIPAPPKDTLTSIKRATIPSNSDQQTSGNNALDSMKAILKSLLAMQIDSAKKDPTSTLPFTIHSVQIQFQDGFVENVQVLGKIAGNQHLLEFRNFYPIPFSTISAFKRLMNIRLYEKTIFRDSMVYVRLGELLSYRPNLSLETKDYSPENQVWPENVTDNITDSITIINLYKEQTSRILEARIFSDLKGIDGENPNGLIQLELSKKINLWSQRKPFKTGTSTNYGLFNYMTPQFAMNKIESNQKRLVLNHFDTVSSAVNGDKPLTYTSTLNLLKHQTFNIGFDLSLFLFDMPAIKSTFYFGPGLYFGRTALQDTLRVKAAGPGIRPRFAAAPTNNVIDFGINTFQFSPFMTWQIYPNKKYGVSVTQRLTSFKALSTDFEQVRDSAHFVHYILAPGNNDTSAQYKQNYLYTRKNSAKWLASTEIFAFFRPSANNRIFFRYRLNWDVNNGKENFHQIQVGLSTFLTSTKDVSKPKPN